jgi:hypothetical protein
MQRVLGARGSPGPGRFKIKHTMTATVRRQFRSFAERNHTWLTPTTADMAFVALGARRARPN